MCTGSVTEPVLFQPALKILSFTFILVFFVISCSHMPSHDRFDGKAQTHIRSNAVPFSKNSSGTFSVLFLGDILLAKNAEAMIRVHGSDHPFSGVQSELSEYTFCVANLETPVTSRGSILVPGKPFIFRIDKDIADTISALEPSCLLIGNNHIMDYGAEGMRDTIKWINSKGWQHCGAGENLEQSHKPSIFQYGNVRVVLFSYNERPPRQFYAGEQSPGTASLDRDIIRKDILSYKSPGTVIIINPHWGLEMTYQPTKAQRRLAHEIIDMGADAIIGQHPHFPQSVEVYHGKIIFYSLGNFIAGYHHPALMDNIAAALHINREAEIQRVEIIPVNGKYQETGYTASILSGKRAGSILRHINTMSKDFGVKMIYDRDRALIELKSTRTTASAEGKK